MKTSKLIGPALEFAVLKAQGVLRSDKVWKRASGLYAEGILPEGVLTAPESVWDIPLGCSCYTTDWSQGGPIIEREGINVRAIRRNGHSMDGTWLAAYDDGNTGQMVQWVKRTDWKKHYLAGPTPLIAAMRCYVASKLGDDVEIPEGLK